jgi:hypothetical protein
MRSPNSDMHGLVFNTGNPFFVQDQPDIYEVAKLEIWTGGRSFAIDGPHTRETQVEDIWVEPSVVRKQRNPKPHQTTRRCTRLSTSSALHLSLSVRPKCPTVNQEEARGSGLDDTRSHCLSSAETRLLPHTRALRALRALDGTARLSITRLGLDRRFCTPDCTLDCRVEHISVNQPSHNHYC